jgi:hypothetical protein
MTFLKIRFIAITAAVACVLPLLPAAAQGKTPVTPDAAPTLSVITSTATVASTAITATLPATASVPTTCAAGGGAWVGYFGVGVTCVDGGGWQSFAAADKSVASDQVNDVAVCGASVVVAHTFGISSRINGRWRTDRIKSSAEAVACDAAGNIWAAHYDGVSVFDGKSFRTIESRRLGSGSGAKVVQDVAVGLDGKVWVVTANSVAMYDGARWRAWEQGAGFARREFFGRVAVDSRGAPWVTAIGGVYTFDDGKWWLNEIPGALNFKGISVDAQDRVLVATSGSGLYIYEDGAWTNLRRENSELSSDDVRAAAVDARGRLWIATAYGLDVVEDEQWRHFRVSNSGLRDDAVQSLAVAGSGPELPNFDTEATGVLAGRVTSAGAPQADVAVELCVEYVGTSFRGASPCAEQPFTAAAQTDADGRYEFTALPAGAYYVVFRAPGGGWLRLMNADGIAPERIAVANGATVDDVLIDLAKAK